MGCGHDKERGHTVAEWRVLLHEQVVEWITPTFAALSSSDGAQGTKEAGDALAVEALERLLRALVGHALLHARAARNPKQPVGDVARFFLVTVYAHGPVWNAAHGGAALRQGPQQRTACAQRELYWPGAGGARDPGAPLKRQRLRRSCHRTRAHTLTYELYTHSRTCCSVPVTRGVTYVRGAHVVCLPDVQAERSHQLLNV